MSHPRRSTTDAASATAVVPAPAVSAPVAVSALLDDVLQDAKQKPDAFAREDIAIPFLRILQDLSPEVKKREDTYVAGAEPGDFLHSVTKRLWKQVNVIPVAYQRHHIEWKTRASGGGFVKDHGYAPELLGTTTKDEKGFDILPNGNQLVTTALYFLLIPTFDENRKVISLEEAVLPLKSTQLKKARMWNALIQSMRIEDPRTAEFVVPRMFYGVYHLTTVGESNDQGSWNGIKVEPYCTMKELPNGGEVYQMARTLAELIERGDKKADLRTMDGAAADETEDEAF
jgi:hypothetical protein